MKCFKLFVFEIADGLSHTSLGALKQIRPLLHNLVLLHTLLLLSVKPRPRGTRCFWLSNFQHCPGAPEGSASTTGAPLMPSHCKQKFLSGLPSARSTSSPSFACFISAILGAAALAAKKRFLAVCKMRFTAPFAAGQRIGHLS